MVDEAIFCIATFESQDYAADATQPVRSEKMLVTQDTYTMSIDHSAGLQFAHSYTYVHSRLLRKDVVCHTVFSHQGV